LAESLLVYKPQTSTSNIAHRAIVKSDLELLLIVAPMGALQVMMFELSTAQDDKLMFKALTTIKLLIFPLSQPERL
jgi:hypothetical protein